MNRFLLIVLALALLFALGACSEKGSGSSAADPLKSGVEDATAVTDEHADEGQAKAGPCCGGTCKTPEGYCCTGVCCPDLPIWDS